MRNYSTIWTNLHQDRYDKNGVNETDSTKSDIELPPRNLSQRWRRYGHDAKRRVFERFSKWCPKGTATSNLFIYLKTDQTFPEFVLKSVIGFFGGIVLTYLCFVFFLFQLSISLIHATIMSSIIGVLLTFGLAFSYRIRCLVFLLIPQLFSRVGRYTLTCYALILILTGPATNTLKNSEVLTESMACTQEQIKMDVKQITDSVKKPFSSMRDAIKVMIRRLNEIAYKVDEILAKINRLVISIVDVLQSSYIWLYDVIEQCNVKFGTPYEHCIKVLTCDSTTRKNEKRKHQEKIFLVPNSSLIIKTVCSTVNSNSKVCNAPEYVEESIAATIKRKLRTFTNRVKAMFFIKIHMHRSYTFTSNSSRSPSQVTAGIVTEIRNRADPLLTWLSWSSCITSLFLLLIIFRAKYYQHMYETHSRFDNRYITKELRDLDLLRSQEGKETVLPLNRRERTKYVTTTSFRLVATEKVHLTRSIVFMAITTFKLMIHMIADYSLYWVLTTIRYHGKRQTQLPPGPMDAGLLITGTGLGADIIRSVFKALIPPISVSPSPMACLPDPYPPDLKRYAQIGVLIFFLWFFALFEPYGLRLRHLIMGHYRPERAKARAAWLYNHILRTRGSFMKFARRKLHKEFKYLPEENLTFRHWLRTLIPFRWVRCILGIAPLEPRCLLCNAKEIDNIPNTELIRCETENCPGTFCTSCFADIGRMCTICLSPVDYGDFSDISLEKGSSEDSDDSSSQTESTILLPKRKCFVTTNRSENSHSSNKRNNITGNTKKFIPKKHRLYSSNQSNENNHNTSLFYTLNEELEENNICQKFLNPKTLNFTHFSVPNNNVTVGYMSHNYFYDSNVLKKYHYINNDFVPKSYNSCKYYGTIDKTLDKQQLNETEITRFIQSQLHQKKPRSPKKENLGSENSINIKTNYNSDEIYLTTQRVRKKPRKERKSRSKTFKIKREYSQKAFCRRINEQTVFNSVKQKLNTIFHSFTSSIAGINEKLESGNIKINVYDIKKSSSTISVSRISLTGKVRYYRKGTRSKINAFQKSRRSTNNVNNHNLQENVNNGERRNSLPIQASNEDDKEKAKFNTYNSNDEITKASKKKTNSKKCLSIKKIRNLFTSLVVKRCTLNKICYSQKKSKVNPCNIMKQKYKYKRRKKYFYHNMKNKNGTHKIRNIRNDNDMTRKYRICTFLQEGDWLKSHFEKEISEPKLQNIRPEIINSVESYCARLKTFIQGIKKAHIVKVNEHFSCTCNNNGIDNPVNSKAVINSKELKVDNKNEHISSEELICHTHLPVLSKSHSKGETGNVIVGHLKLSSSVKSFSIKNVKLYISNKFLHVKFGNPINVLKTFFSTITLTKDKQLSPEIIVCDDKKTVDKDVASAPITKSCTCQCEIIKDPTQYNSELRRLASYPKLYDHKDDKQTQTETKSCTCATQYSLDNTKRNNYDSFIDDLYKGFDNDKEFSRRNSFVSDSTRTDTTLCNCITVDNVDETPKIKDNTDLKKLNIKTDLKKLNVITKSNQSTATDITNLRNASTVTSDWWSPIVEKKEIDYRREHQVYKKKREVKHIKTSMNRRLVTFKSRTQVIPHGESYILSPSRYLLESQKYYNELFSPRFYAPHLFPVNRTTQEQKSANVSGNRVNKSHKTRRLEQRRSSGIKLNQKHVNINTRSDETFSVSR